MAQLISSQLIAAQKRVQLVFMDCFGAVRTVSLSILSGPSAADKTTSVLAEMTTAEDAVKAYATANAQDLTEQLAAGQAAVDAAIAAAVANGTRPSSGTDSSPSTTP